MHVLLVVISLCAAAWAQTLVQDTLYTPFGGQRFNGVITIVGPALTSADGRTVVPWTKRIAVSDGRLSVRLEANDNASPSGTSYTVRYQASTGETWVEYWLVPTSATAVRVADVRVTPPPTPALTIQPTQIASGGARDGEVLTWIQAANHWEPRGVAIDASQITSGVLSLARGGTGQSAWTAGTCVQVSADGTRLESTSGPCGTGGGGGGGVGGSGSAGSLARWVTGSTLGNSSLTESTSDVSSSKPIKAELRDQGGAVFNVRAFGARGDQSDDTAAVQAAINAAQAVGGTVYFPPGRYAITSPLSITASVVIAGAGADVYGATTSQILRVGATGNLFEIDASGHVQFRDLVLGRAATGSASGAAIYVQRSTGNALQKLTIHNVSAMHFFIVADIDRTEAVSITDSSFSPGNATITGSVGIRVQNSDNADNCGSHIHGSMFSGYETGVLTKCGSLNMIGNTFNGITQYAWRHIQGAQHSGQLTVVGNNFDTPGGRVRIETVSGGGMVRAVTFANNFMHTSGITTGGAVELHDAGPAIGQVIIEGNNLFLFSTNRCFSITGSIVNDVNIIGNYCLAVDSNVQYGIYNAQGFAVEAKSNKFTFVTTPYYTTSTSLRVTDFALTYSQLGTFANGSYGYCSDCTVAATCASGGTGAFARRISSAWVCSEGGGGGGGVSGSGTAGRLPVWTGPFSLGDSALSQSAAAVTVDRPLVVQGQAEASSVTLNSTAGGSVALRAPSTSSNFTLTLPAANGTLELQGHEHDASAISSGTLPVSRGGTGASSFTGGRCIQSSADGQSLTVTSGACAVDGHSHTLAGDVTGNISSTTVTRIQGRNVSSTAPSDGQALMWNAAESQWKPATVSGGGGSFDALDETVLWYRENFPNRASTSNTIGTYGWELSCTNGGATHVGTGNGSKTVRLTSSNTSGSFCAISLGSIGPGGTIIGRIGSYAGWGSVFRFRLNATSNVRIFVGYIRGGTFDIWTNAHIGLSFDTTAGDTQFFFSTHNGTNNTRVASGVAVDENWHTLRIRSTASGTIVFNLDDGPDVTINTNVATNTAMAPVFYVDTREASAKTIDVLRWYWSGPDVR